MTEAEKYALLEGDIVIARTGATTGYAKRLNKRHPKSVFASYLVRIRPNTVLGKHYAGVIVESNKYKEFIKRNLAGLPSHKQMLRFLHQSTFWFLPQM